MKMFVKRVLNRLAREFFSCLPLKPIILFESAPDLSDNTKPVFDEMLRRGINKHYKMVWIVSSATEALPAFENVIYCGKNNGFFNYKLIYYRCVAKVLICCNDFFPSLRKGQTSFYLTHGTGVKNVRNYYNVPSNMDFVLVDGEGTRALGAYQLNFDIDKTFAMGYPRNDILVSPSRNIKTLFPGTECNKLVVWYPTFRQHKLGILNAAKKALPILHNEEQAQKLNEIAKENGILLVLKPHFAQDVSQIKACLFSNIKFIDDDFYRQHEISSYEFLANCDALLTDYSSVYYDYLLCDKPIGLVWEDYEEYRATTDFAVDMDYYMKGGEKIYNLQDFAKFLQNLAEGKDLLKKERAEISAWANYSRDGKSAVRVTDFIVEKANIEICKKG